MLHMLCTAIDFFIYASTHNRWNLIDVFIYEKKKKKCRKEVIAVSRELLFAKQYSSVKEKKDSMK